MKRFLLFWGDYYYPAGGWDDSHEEFDSLDAAKAAREAYRYEWSHIVDFELGEVVARREGKREWEIGS